MEGWIKIHRLIQNWEWYDDSKMVHLFLHLLLSANHKDGSWRGIKIKRGQLIFGRKKASERTGISERSIRTCLDKLKSTEELTIKTTNRYSIITVCKYEDYQLKESDTDQPEANKRPTNDQQTTTNKKDKKKKNDMNITLPFESDYFKNTLDEFIDHRKSIKKKMTDLAIKKMLSRLVKLSDNIEAKAILILDQSIEMGWAGLFELKDDGQNNSNNEPVKTEVPDYSGDPIEQIEKLRDEYAEKNRGS